MRREVFGRQQVDRRACEPTHLRTRALSHEGCRGESAWTSPAALELHPHALADVARLPVREIVSGA